MDIKRIAKKICGKSDHRQHHHSTLIVSGGGVIAVGYNKGEIHSEVTALKKLRPLLRQGVTIYNFRFRKGGTFGISKPCPKCEQYLRDNGVKVVYYTDTDGEIKKMKL